MSSSTAKSRLLTVAEVAERLRISKRGAYRIAPAIGTTGPTMMFDERDVERYIAANMHGALRERERHPLAAMLAEDGELAIADLPTCCGVDGYVYFVRHLDLVKIGRSQSGKLGSRLAHLQCQSPVALKLAQLSRGYDLEARLHEIFKHDRAHGEWFKARPVLDVVGKMACVRCAIETP